MSKPDYVRKHFVSLKSKTLKNALAQRIAQDFPRIGGRRIQLLCAEMILEALESHLRPREHLSHGQALWMAVPIDHPPRRHQRIADTPLVPVVLDISTTEDIDRRLKRQSPRERLLQKALRLCRQAYEQGGLLSNCDLAELLNTSDSRIATILSAYERETGSVTPRRGTIHDVGTATTHKRVICHKHYAEGKSADQVARETRHSLEAVDRYLGQYDRVRHCRLQGLSPRETAHILNCSLALVREYLEIDGELEP